MFKIYKNDKKNYIKLKNFFSADEEEEKMIAQLRDIVNNDSVTENLTNNFFVEEFVKCSVC